MIEPFLIAFVASLSGLYARNASEYWNLLKSEICIPMEYNQTILHQDCIPKIIENKVCIGACASSFQPRHGSKNVIRCKQCYGDDMEEIRIELKCPRRKRNKRKKVTIVRSCRCRSCKPVIPKIMNWSRRSFDGDGG